jgi:two-component system sensor histidine kinase HupT/HoxJ
LLNHILSDASVATVVDLPEELPLVQGSLEQLAQILINLMLNAVESMPNGGELRVMGLASEEQLIVTLCNNGPPVPPEYLPRLFEPFFTTKPAGAGLGLFASHVIVEQHDGSLTVANLPNGDGVECTLTLPLASSESTHAQVDNAAEKAEP